MRGQPNLDSPPGGAQRLMGLFANAEDPILGDLAEEYSQVALRSGRANARRWYWRQTLKTLPQLVASPFRTAPLPTIGAAGAGFLLRRLVGRLPQLATFALVDRFNLHEHHFALYRFLASTALDIEHALSFFMVGCVVALVARRREMAPAVVLAMIYGGMAVVGTVWFLTRGGDYGNLWRLSWYFSDSLAVVLGALVVRTMRSKVTDLSPQH